MTDEIYAKDAYVKTFKGKVTSLEGNGIILDKTAFHPRGGGLESDTGEIISEGNHYRVLEVKRVDGKIIHVLDRIEGLAINAEVEGVIDWERRYRMMRLHTASHIIASIAYTKYNALITGGNITPEYAKDDFDLENKDLLPKIVEEANQIANKSIPVKVYFLSRSEAMKIPGVVKLAEKMPPDVQVWRIVEIEGVDLQADGGPHVANTKEIGTIEIIKVENRGKGKKRLYYTVKP
ncbi:alanyl-tRNA editing protein [Metallosphaera tengchongensis]|uniref:Alanyl-tRNA editing protein n=1 Tax=Metallosphaera tengchongensis TaxID=1532350 RepID=A0A6N0NSE8_9CREN|nr:alanyl-tRNA editing protein AlaXM [Metallosphaera tengchongensis]QKQ99763.1 alanyl-tRNA editing protein [Metallosphaera tengchongensis]